MAEAVWQTLSDGGILLVEAGTGVGKSMAYLFPATVLAAFSKRRVVISTHTVNLQEQLVSKDLPSLNEFWKKHEVTIRWDLVKGRGHYLCLRKFNRRYDQTLKQTDLFSYTKPEEDLIKELKALIDRRSVAEGTESPCEGSATHADGSLPRDSRGEASANPGDEHPAPAPVTGLWDGDVDRLEIKLPPVLWSEFASDTESCMGAKCPYKTRCFYRLARASLDKCHILVVNHALLVSDLRLRVETNGKTRLLPAYDTLIIDEAHHFESVVREHLGASISSWRLKRLAGDTLREVRSEPLSRFIGKKQVDSLKETLGGAIDSLESILDSLLKQVKSRESEKARLTQKAFVDEKLVDGLREVAATVNTWLDYDLTQEERFEVSSLRRRFIELADDLDKFDSLEGNGEDTVYWVERASAGGARVDALRSCPLEVANYLQENLWSELRSAVLTSATLTVGKRDPFGYVKSVLGLESAGELKLGSPFRYEEQACLCVPGDSRGYDPNSPEFLKYVARTIPEIADLTFGRCFVLFTSYKAMDSVVQRIRDVLEAKGFPVLKQGDDSREALLREFKKLGNAMLFGVDSFWEGVDVPGNALSCVVVVKLPFSVPDDPVVQARSELWESQGRSPFWSYFVPKAALKLKQGFGRLIRTKTDRGAVVILDPRIVTRDYGKVLLESLPPARITAELEDIARAVNPPSGPVTLNHRP